MEESHDKCDVRAWAVEAAESEIAEARCKFGRSPSLVLSWAEEKCVLEDLHKEGIKGIF